MFVNATLCGCYKLMHMCYMHMHMHVHLYFYFCNYMYTMGEIFTPILVLPGESDKYRTRQVVIVLVR